jgi:FkbM family methyltransferase
MSLIKGLIKSMLEPAVKDQVHTIKRGLGRGFKIKGGFFSSVSLFLRREDLTTEERFLLSLDLRCKVVYDIGAYIGITTMFFARSVGNVGKVIAFEPNPENCVKLQENVALNNFHNVRIMKIGLGDKEETKTLAVRGYESATGSVKEEIKSRILKEWHSKCFQVKVYSLDIYIEENNLPKPDFVKIDVEGEEYNVLLGMKNTISKHNPSLFIEIHGIDVKSKIENVQKIVEFLDLHGYSIYHVESGKMISTKAPQIAKRGHVFAQKKGAQRT